MKIASFRLRIAVLAVALSGAVLLAFSAWTWRLVERTSLERIDAQIAEVGRPQLARRQPRDHWRQLGDSLQLVFGVEEGGTPPILLVKDRLGAVVFQSALWPDELDPATFASPMDWEGELPAARPRFGRNRFFGPFRGGARPGDGPPPEFGPPPEDGLRRGGGPGFRSRPPEPTR